MSKNEWIHAEVQKPLDGETVLGICWGRRKWDGCILEGAYEFVEWSEAEGWALPEFEYEPVEVRWWQPLPAAPLERGEEDAAD